MLLLNVYIAHSSIVVHLLSGGANLDIAFFMMTVLKSYYSSLSRMCLVQCTEFVMASLVTVPGKILSLLWSTSLSLDLVC